MAEKIKIQFTVELVDDGSTSVSPRVSYALLTHVRDTLLDTGRTGRFEYAMRRDESGRSFEGVDLIVLTVENISQPNVAA